MAPPLSMELKLSELAESEIRDCAGRVAAFAGFFVLDVAGNSSEPIAACASPDDCDVDRFIERVTVSGKILIERFDEALRHLSVRGAGPAPMVRRRLVERLRESTGVLTRFWSKAPRGGALPAPLVVLSQPGRQGMPIGLDPEAAMEQAVARLLETLGSLPEGSQGAERVRNAILVIRRALALFDTKPIQIRFLEPAGEAVLNFVPRILFEMTDSGSGPDPASRKLEAVNEGPILPSTVDLTAFTQVVLSDPVAGRVSVGATVPDAALADGFITLVASGTDFARNAPATATRPFVLDRRAPAISFTAPVEGGTVIGSAVPLEATLEDLVSGIELTTVSVELDRVDVTRQTAIEVLESTRRGVPARAKVSGVLAVTPGSHTLSVRATDLAGNPGAANVTFTVTPPVGDLFEETPIPEVTLEKLPPDDPHSQREESYVTTPSGTLRVRAKSVDGSTAAGIDLVARLVEGEGRIIPDRRLSFITGADGIGGFRIAFGQKTGTHTVDVSAANAVVRQPLRFTVEAFPFLLDAVITSDHETAGKIDIMAPAYTHLKVTGPSGATILDPELTTHEIGDPRAVFCTATAVFLVPGLGSGGFYGITVEALDVKDGEGRPLRVTRVDHTSDPTVSGAKIVSGQGQRAYPGKSTYEPLVARLAPFPPPAPQPDRILFTVMPGTPGCLPSFNGREFPGRLIVVDGASPIFEGPASVSLLPVNGVASVRYEPALPVSVLIGLGATFTPTDGAPLANSFVPQDIFMVGAPRTYLVRKTSSGGFDPIPVDSPDPFIRTADVLDNAGNLKDPDNELEFHVEMETADFGDTLTAGVMGIAVHREPLAPEDGFAPVPIDVEMKKVSGQGVSALYRSGPFAMTMFTRTRAEQERVSVLPGDVRLVQSDFDAVVAPHVPFTVPWVEADGSVTMASGRFPGAARQAKTPVWVFLGDSLTIGTQGKCVVKTYQEASYPVQACKLTGLAGWRVGAIEESGTPPRIWTDPRGAAGEAALLPNLVVDPSDPFLKNPTLFAELTVIREPFGRREEGTRQDFANVLAIDGTEIRQAITQGRFTDGVSGIALMPGAPGTYGADFTLEALAGMEHESYLRSSESEQQLGQEILNKNATQAPGDLSQVSQAHHARPDMVAVLLGNNDTLQAILNGSSIQARVTPFDDFNPTLHKQELEPLQDILDHDLSDSIPTLFSDATRAGALAKLGFTTTKSAIDAIAARIAEVPGDEPGTRKRPDVLLMTIPDTRDAALLVPMTDGARIGDLLRRTNAAVPERLPFRVVLYGVDITGDIHEMRLDSRVTVFDGEAPGFERRTDGRFGADTRVSLAALLARMGRRLEGEIGQELAGGALVSLGLRKLFNARESVRATLRGIVQANWTAGLNLREKIILTPYSFRADEVLQPADVTRIGDVINEFNRHLKENVAPAHGFALFDLHGLFKQALSPEGFAVKDSDGVEVDRVKATWRGQLFSLDGGHLGNYGNLILAGEMLEAMKAAAGGNGTFGGVPVSGLKRASASKLQEVKRTDEAIRGAERNP